MTKLRILQADIDDKVERYGAPDDAVDRGFVTFLFCTLSFTSKLVSAQEEHIRSQKRTIQFNDDKVRRLLNKGLTLTQGLQMEKDLSRR